jgi:mono/diheme cytochrome c family protein
MPRKPPAEPIDHHYNIPKLNRVLAGTAILLTVVFVGMVVEDYARGWKKIQRAFARLDAKKTREAALEARKSARGEERQKLRAELTAARNELRSHQRRLRSLRERVRKLEPRVYLADQEYKFTRASYDAQRYKYEDALARDPAAAPKEKRDLEKLQKELDAKTLALAEANREQAAVQSELDRLTSGVESVNAAIEKLTADYRLAAQKYASLQQDTIYKLRNSPILDMVNPSLRVDQLQLPDHYNNVNFMRIPRVDRCTTCHVAADREGFQDAKLSAVFRSHPERGLMIASESPHPLNLFGCTPCHGGRDRASSFWSAGHSPETPREAARWAERHDWHFDRFNATPILPLKYTEAGCYRCHANEASFRDAPTLDAGMKLVENLGCWGCHRIAGLDAQGIPKVGPSLQKVASKVSKDWATRWVMNPAAFRPNTKMPTVFYLENFVDVSGPEEPTEAQKKMNEEGRIENDAMVNSIVAYLYARSRPATVPPVSGSGDPARGQRLLAERGCFGCHQADPNALRDLTGTYRQFGPNLAGVGSKVSREWIYHWIRDPKAWNPETKMPNLRLTHEDALDMAEYLMTLKGPNRFESVPLPRTDPATLDRIALYFKVQTMTVFDAKAELAKMDPHVKQVYVGEMMITNQGCFACHDIPGFEDAKPIGTELTEEGSKAVHRLDFGFLHIPHTRHDWFETKLHNPRIFDRGHARGWEEKYRMPDFRLSRPEIEKLVTALLGFQELNAADSAKKALSGEEAAVERGRRIVKNNNCLGCHVIEGWGGSFRSLVADTSLAPPIIQGQGAKVQSDWLFAFLKAPRTGQIRPWLEVHMPTFGFDERELNDLTSYFAYLDRASYPFLSGDYAARPASWAAGRKAFQLLRCAQCHPSSEAEMNAPGVDRSTLAPNLQMAATRLRHDWIADWIKRPDEWMPGTRMPTNFPKGEDGKRFSPLGAQFEAPSFAADRAEFVRILGSEEAARQFLNDPDAVTKALRDYVWSLGPGSTPSPPPPAREIGPTVRAFGAPPPAREASPARGSAGSR